MRVLKPKIELLISSIILTAFFVIEAQAQFKQIRTNEEIVAWSSDYMDNAAKYDHFSGAVLIARDGKPIFHQAYGMSNYELDAPKGINVSIRKARRGI